ncbi:hypothetical protein Hdeb2414_s0005g00182281 [Helianthus debilis subsp. tardiflorus]
MAGSQWLCVNSCPQPKLPTQAPPYPMGVSFFFFFPFFPHSTCQPMPQPMPQPKPTIPHSLR